MPLILGAFKKSHILVIEICQKLETRYPRLLKHAVVAGIHIPKPIRWLDRRFFGNKLGAYAMCLNHWLHFLPVPVVLINDQWLGEDANLWDRYAYDVASNYHPECGCPIRYIIWHEIAHFIYVNMTPGERSMWNQIFEHQNPTGYSTNPEESYCEAFSGHLAGLKGRYYDEAPGFAVPYV